jgi:hypothetical protein
VGSQANKPIPGPGVACKKPSQTPAAQWIWGSNALTSGQLATRRSWRLKWRYRALRPLASGGATPPGSQVTVLRVALGRSPVTGKKPDQAGAAAAGGRHPPSDRRGMMHRSGRLPDSRRAPGPCPGSQLAASCPRIQPGSGRGSMAKERASSAYMLSVGGRGCTVRAGAARRVQGS